MQKIFIFIVIGFLSIMSTSIAFGASDEFKIQQFTPNDFYVFVKVFSEMRGPLRVEILKDRKKNFEDVDPLAYVEKVKKEKDVRKMLKKNDLTWESFRTLMGNVLLGYFSIQPNKTKAGLLRQLASYGLLMEMDEIPEEYRPIVTEVLKTEEGSMLAGAMLEQIIEIPAQNVEIARKNQKQLDRLFYTKYWKDLLN